MARISTYAIDGTVDNMDKLLGSTQDGTTANFTADVIADYYLRYAGAEASKHALPFAYGGTINGLANIPSTNAGMIYVYAPDGETPDETFSNIKTLAVSTTSNAADPSNAVDVQPILNQYIGEIIKVAGATTAGAKNYALYKVTAVNEAFSYSGLYSLDVDYIESSSDATSIATADQYNAIILADVAAGDVTLSGLIREVSVQPNVANGTYTLTITPEAGDAFTSTWTDVSHTILSGADAPLSSIGADGDFYLQLNDSERILFGPKASGNWGSGQTLNGLPVSKVTYTGGANPGDTTTAEFFIDNAGTDVSIGSIVVQPGEDGTDGADGAAGRGINSVEVVSGNALRIVYSDGAEETTDPLNFTQVNADWNATSGAAQILNKPTNLTEFSDTETGKVYTWAEGGNSDKIPADKLDATAFETHVFDGNYTQLKAATDNDYQDGEIWILTNPGDSDSNAYLFVGDPGSGATDDDDWVPFQSTGANLDVNPQANTVVITNTAGTNATIPAAGTSAGVMTSADKSKLESIAGGAEVNVQSNWTETNTSSDAFILNKPATITSDQATNIANSKTITDAIDLNGKSATDKFVFDDYSVVSVEDAPDGTTPTPLDELKIDDTHYIIDKGSAVTVDGGDQQDIDIIQQTAPVRFSVSDDDELTIEADTAVGTGSDQTDGLMTHQDKTKLDGIAAGAEVNVQASWTQANSSDPAFIVSKPTLVGASDNPFSGYGFMSAADKEKLDNLVENGGGTVVLSTSAAPDGSMTAISATVTTDDGTETTWALGGGGTDVEANPSDSATDTLSKIKIDTTTYSIPADEIDVNGTSILSPNLDDTGIFTWTVSGSNINFQVAEANIASSGATHGIVSASDAKDIADTATQVTTNTGNISTLQTQVGNINSFDPENAGTDGQVLARTANAGEYEWVESGDYEGITVKHTGDSDVDKVHTLNLIGTGISIARDGSDSDQVNITITGGGGGTNPITVQNPTFSPDETKFENEDQTPSLTATWDKESDITYNATGSQIVITKGTTTVQTRALTLTELNAGTVTFNTSTLDFVTSNSDNTIQNVVITTTVKGTNSSNDDVEGSNTFTYTFPALMPALPANPISNPTLFENPNQSHDEGQDNFIESWDGGEFDLDIDPDRTGWTAGTPTVTFDGSATPPSGWTYSSSGSERHLHTDENNTSLVNMKAVTVYTQSSVPSGKTAITATLTTLENTSFTRGQSVRFGMAPADDGSAPTFTDNTATNYGLRKLDEWTGTDRSISWGDVKPQDAGTLEVTNTTNGNYLYFCYANTEGNLTKVTESGFPKTLTDFTGPTTIGAYKCYINKKANSISPVAIPYTITN